MKKLLAIWAGKMVFLISQLFRLGAGGTWVGEVGLMIEPKILSYLLPKEARVIVVSGTNGKTTTTKLIESVFRSTGERVVTNDSGANLVNGIASTLINNADWKGKTTCKNFVFEIDENSLLPFLQFVHADIIVLLNLFRDQLDRYGEVDKISKGWLGLSNWSNLVINADDPQLSFIGQKFKENVYFFGLGDRTLFLEKMQHATDSIFCPNCGKRLKFEGVYFSHLGEYFCQKCGFGHPANNRGYRGNLGYGGVEGVYNYYNFLAAESVAEILKIKANFSSFRPAFGRMEEIGKTKILLSKNPAGFNESLRTVLASKRKGALLLALNDRIPDGRDVSWIWDVDFEKLQGYPYSIFVCGDRRLDLALRLKYGGIGGVRILGDMGEIKDKISWILPTYSAMLEIRKKLTGKKIL